MHPDDLFTAPQLAALCGVELKTIHNWIGKGMIKHFRSPGRHIRIRREDLIDFMERFGYPLPEELKLNAEKPVVAIVDSDTESVSALKRSLNRKFEVKGFNDPYEALITLGADPPSAVVLNLDMNGFESISILKNLKKSPRFSTVPVITMGSDPSRKDDALNAGADDFLSGQDTKKIRSVLETALQSA